MRPTWSWAGRVTTKIKVERGRAPAEFRVGQGHAITQPRVGRGHTMAQHEVGRQERHNPILVCDFCVMTFK